MHAEVVINEEKRYIGAILNWQKETIYSGPMKNGGHTIQMTYDRPIHRLSYQLQASIHLNLINQW